jgi:ABC-type amino acid transport substrate-binding protein
LTHAKRADAGVSIRPAVAAASRRSAVGRNKRALAVAFVAEVRSRKLYGCAVRYQISDGDFSEFARTAAALLRDQPHADAHAIEESVRTQFAPLRG